MTVSHCYQDLIRLFSVCFLASHNTILVNGDGEPEYRPAHGNQPCNRVIFAHGFYSSALHEISHWCIAGEARRHQVDYGYWYRPDGRTAEEQAQFEEVEVRPQALEWLFSQAAGSTFHLSLDNLSGETSGHYTRFRSRVWHQAHRYLEEGLPRRGAQFVDALLDFYNRRSVFGPALFSLESLK